MEIIKDIKNNLLKRQEIRVSLEAEKNPDFNEMEKQISEKFGKPKEVIDVYNIKGSFGSHEFKIDAYIYDSKEDLEKAKSKKKQEAKKEVKAGEEKSEEKSEQVQKEPEAKPAETPVEEKAEEKEKAVKEEKQGEEEAKEN